MANTRKLVKVDHNGTKYYEELIPCPRCGGKGIYFTGVCNGQLIPARPDAGVCYLCNGAGTVLDKTKEYTPEHEAKLKKARERREAKARAEMMAKAHELNAVFLQKKGFDAQGNIWIILGDTFSIKDELKALGCRFDNLMGWHCDHELAEYPSAKLSVDELADVDINGCYFWASYSDISNKCEKKRHEYLIKNETSQHVGFIGDKIEVTARLTACHSYSTTFNYHHVTNWIYTFKELETGNVFVWKTTAIISENVGDVAKLKGTIKGHSEYNGIKQTELQRCKVTKEVA